MRNVKQEPRKGISDVLESKEPAAAAFQTLQAVILEIQHDGGAAFIAQRLNDLLEWVAVRSQEERYGRAAPTADAQVTVNRERLRAEEEEAMARGLFIAVGAKMIIDSFDPTDPCDEPDVIAADCRDLARAYFRKIAP